MKTHALLALICLSLLTPSLFGQTNTPAADTNSVAASPAPTGQAPEDVMKKLSGLVHNGKYAEAQQLTTGLLLAYPDDQRLIKAKTLLDKLLATAASTNAVPSSGQPANSLATIQPVANTNSMQLTGMDRVEYNSLIELGKEAQQTTDLDQQKTLLHRFMAESKPFLEKYPNDMLLWQLRAASALSLDDMVAGYEAGQKLLASGKADNDPTMQRLLSQLNLKGWLDKKIMEAQRKQDENAKKFSWCLGPWKVSYTWPNHGGLMGSKEGSRGEEDFQLSGSIINGYEIDNAGVRCTPPDLRGTILDSGEIKWECYLPPANPGELFFFHKLGWGGTALAGWVSDWVSDPAFGQQMRELMKGPFYPSGWQPVISYAANNDGTFTIVIPAQDLNSKSDRPLKNPVTLVFTKTSGTQNEQVQPQQLPSK